MSNTTIKNIASVFPITAENLKFDGHRSIIKDFSLNTTTHGIPGIARSNTLHNRIFWSISFVIFTGVTCYFISEAIRAYFQYETQTSLNFHDQWPQAFPAVTICNYSPFRFDFFINDYLNYTNTFNLTNTNDTKTLISEDESLYIYHFLQYKLNRNESLNNYFYSLNDMLIKCVYNNENCSVNDFVEFVSPTYGLCYTFNALSSSINNGTIHYNNENGYSGRLDLDIYLHSRQYVPYLSDGISLVTMVHDNTQLPLIDRTGIQLRPGQKYKLGYSKRTNTLLPLPYTTCNSKVTPGMQAMFDQFSGATYDFGHEICFVVAVQTFTYVKCGCVSPFEWSARYVVLPGRNDVIYSLLCNISDPCYSQAAEQFQSTESLWIEYASDCGLECYSNEFLIKKSSSSAPPPWSMDTIKQFVQSTSIPLDKNWSTIWKSEIEKNYVGLSVICESTRVESYIQQASIGIVDVISNIGGQTGLWIGMSFLSLFEIAEMIFRLCRHQFHFFRNKFSNH